VPLVPKQPLPGLASTIASLTERVRALESRRLGAVGATYQGAYSTSSTINVFPPGWPSKAVTLGASGYAQVTVGCTIDTSTGYQEGEVNLYLDGVSLGGVIVYQASGGGFATLSGVFIIGASTTAPTTPGSHTYALGCNTSQTSGQPVATVTFLDPTLIITPL
jgi:hypothetical protein